MSELNHQMDQGVELLDSKQPVLESGVQLSVFRLLWSFVKPYRRFAVLAILFLMGAAGITLYMPKAVGRLLDASILLTQGSQTIEQLRLGFLGLFGLAITLGGLTAARFYVMSWLGERVSSDLRNRVYAHVMRQSPEFFESTKTGEVLSRLTTDTTVIQSVIGSSFSMGLRNAILFVGALIALIILNPKLMGMVMGVLFLVVFPAIFIGRRVRKLSRASQDRVADSSAIAAEMINAIHTVQAYNQQDREIERFFQTTQSAFQTAINRARARALLTVFIIIAVFGALLFGLYEGAIAVINGEVTPGQLSQIVMYIMMLASSSAVLAEVYGDLLRAAGATDRLVELLQQRSTIVSPDHVTAIPDTEKNNRGASLRFEGVQFAYPSRPNYPTLKSINFSVQPGTTVAIVGPSGAGKSTLFQLIARMYDPQVGQIMLQDVPIREAKLETVRDMMAIVPQDPVIFSTSALENIRYGRPSATKEEVVAAAKMANAHDFIVKMADGYDTYLGERGVRLSGGQRQRIVIARAMLKNPPLLLLDEATSALDSESERLVQEALDSAMRNRTTLVIAHRLSTVQSADWILVLDQGMIVEQGTHNDLLALNGLYAHLAALQFNYPR